MLALIDLCVHLAETESLTAFVSILIAADAQPALAEAVRGTALAPRRQDCDEILERAAARGEITDARGGDALFDLVMGKILIRFVVERRALEEDERAPFVDDVLLPAISSLDSSLRGQLPEGQ